MKNKKESGKERTEHRRREGEKKERREKLKGKENVQWEREERKKRGRKIED